MKGVYNALLGANGYINIEISGVYRLTYVAPKSIKPVDFTGLNPYQIDEVEIDITIVEDLKLHKLTEGEQGYKVVSYKLKDLGSFKRLEEY